MRNQIRQAEKSEAVAQCQRCGQDNGKTIYDKSRFGELEFLTAETESFLKNTFYEFLCSNCLSDLNDMMTASEKYPYPTEKHEVVENIHFYKEKGYWVFTELYSMQRGHCCGNGCRHCAYGYKLKK